MATFKINGKNFATQDGTGAATIHSDVVFPAGHVLQVVSTTKTDFFSTTSTTYVDVTGLSATITPSSTSSKILVSVTGASSGSADNSFGYAVLLRDSTQILLATQEVAHKEQHWTSPNSKQELHLFGQSILQYIILILLQYLLHQSQ